MYSVHINTWLILGIVGLVSASHSPGASQSQIPAEESAQQRDHPAVVRAGQVVRLFQSIGMDLQLHSSQCKGAYEHYFCTMLLNFAAALSPQI